MSHVAIFQGVIYSIAAVFSMGFGLFTSYQRRDYCYFAFGVVATIIMALCAGLSRGL